MEEPIEKYLNPTLILDSDNKSIIETAQSITFKAGKDPVEMAIRLYYFVRDSIWYDPYYPFYLPEHYRASNVLKIGRGFCIPKASLLCALGRACHIPSRVGFAHVRNHLATRQLVEFMGSDLFVYHGFTEFHLEGKWVRATPAFNSELCKKHKVAPLEFNGKEDSIFHEYNLENRQFMEYVEYLGSFSDIPVEKIVKGFEQEYGKERTRQWIKEYEERGGKSIRDFKKEDVLQGKNMTPSKGNKCQ